MDPRALVQFLEMQRIYAGKFEKLRQVSHSSFASSSRVTELALSVEQLQNQNTEKDQVNRTLSDKLAALVRCGSMMWHQPDLWLLAEGQAAWDMLNVSSRLLSSQCMAGFAQ